MAADGVAQCFKTTILSSKVRLRKPDPDIYHLACRCIGTPEANCAYVGDNPVRDVEGTQAAGFGMMIRIDEPDTLNKEKATGKEFTPDHVITSLSELLDIFLSGLKGGPMEKQYKAVFSTWAALCALLSWRRPICATPVGKWRRSQARICLMRNSIR